MYTLRYYQEAGITDVARKLASGKRKVIFQLATGGGKTVTFAAICNRYIQKSQKPILILVHREELLEQTRLTLYQWYGIIAELITPQTKRPATANVYIGMAETVYRRKADYLPPLGLVIVDECHIGNFKKLHAYYQLAFIIGFTATPVAATKKDPLKNYFDDIVCGVDIPELIASGNLVRNHTYCPKNVDRTSLVMKGNNFDEAKMGAEYSKGKHVQNTVDAYKKHGKGTTLVFNCNISHSLLVTAAFQQAGYPCRHIDSDMCKKDPKIRKETIRWLKNTPGGILCNVGILTTGFDEPCLQTIIVNKSTTSLSQWLQMCGRGARRYPGKEYFTIIDMGSNAIEHGDWCDARDWADIFHNPVKPRKKLSVAPIKICPQCEFMLPAQATKCPECGYEWLRETKYDVAEVELQLVTKNIDITKLVEENKTRGYKDYYTLFQIGTNMAYQARKLPSINTPTAERLLTEYHIKAKEWCHLHTKRFNQWHKDTTKDHLYKQLQLHFPNWNPHA